MDVARIVRHGIKHGFALIALASAGIVLLQAVKPEATAKLFGSEYSPDASPPLAGKIIEGMFSGSNGQVTQASKGYQGFDTSALFSGGRPHKSSVGESPPSVSSIFARVAQNGIGSLTQAGTSGTLLTFNDLESVQPTPDAAAASEEKAAPVNKLTAVETEAPSSKSPQRASETLAFTRPPAAAPAQPAKALPAEAKPDMEPAAVPERRAQEKPAAQEPARTQAPKVLPRNTLAEDVRVAQALIANARLDVRVVPYAAAAVRAISQTYPDAPESGAVSRSLAELRVQLKDELRQRSHAEKGATLIAADFSPDMRTGMKRCLGEISGLKSLHVAQRLLQPYSPVPAYFVLADISNSERQTANLHTCLRPMFTAGTVAIFFGRSKNDTPIVEAIRKRAETKFFARGLSAAVSREKL